MLTPFTDENEVDYPALGRLVEWYIDAGVSGLFAVCQSSEMYCLSLEESTKIAAYIVKKVNGRIPVVASGHISESFEGQVNELNRMCDTGIDALILLSNKLAAQDESDDVWLHNMDRLLLKLPESMPLGFYECPVPYKRVLSPRLTSWCAQSGRFYFLKDTCCDIELIKEKIDIIKGSNLKLFNANTTTLLDSLKLGAAGFSGVMANFHPELYSWLCRHYDENEEKSKLIASFLTIASFVERQVYPANAKYLQCELGNFNSIQTRVKDPSLLNATAVDEVHQLIFLTDYFRQFIED